jgi:hypothetical protein
LLGLRWLSAITARGHWITGRDLLLAPIATRSDECGVRCTASGQDFAPGRLVPHLVGEHCPHCHRCLIEIDYYGERLIGCIQCNVWARSGDATLPMQLRDDDLKALHKLGCLGILSARLFRNGRKEGRDDFRPLFTSRCIDFCFRCRAATRSCHQALAGYHRHYLNPNLGELGCLRRCCYPCLARIRSVSSLRSLSR